MGSLGLPANSESFNGCGLSVSWFSIRRFIEVWSELSGVLAVNESSPQRKALRTPREVHDCRTPNRVVVRCGF